MSNNFAPKKVLLLGNSLLLGMFEKYGMCATDPKSDYAYYLSQRLRNACPDCQISKLRISAFEACESVEDFENWYENKALPYLDPELEFISFQFLDNVNNEKRQQTLRTSLPALLQRMRERCPKARIVWTYGWYMHDAIFDFALATAQEFGLETIDIRTTHTKENESYSGQISQNAEGEPITVDDEWITHPSNSGMRAIADIMIAHIFGEG